MNPEFLTEGQAIADFMHPDRIVLGRHRRAHDATPSTNLYAGFAGVPVLRTNPSDGGDDQVRLELAPGDDVSFSNEIANLCAALGGVDVVDVMRGVHASAYLTVRPPGGARRHAPITSFLEAGCGFGGAAFPRT